MTTSEKNENNLAKETLSYSFHNSRWGQVLIASSPKGICFVSFAEDTESAREKLQSHFPKAFLNEKNDPAHQNALDIIDGKLSDASKIKLDIVGSEFQKTVWDALLQIPYGNTSTYSEIANRIGRPKAVRAVGNAIGRNNIAVLIPCHRIVRSTGKLSGYRWGVDLKKKILEQECKEG